MCSQVQSRCIMVNSSFILRDHAAEVVNFPRVNVGSDSGGYCLLFDSQAV